MEKEALSHASFRFYQELNDFLPRSRKNKEFIYSFFGKPTVKDAIENLGVPHTEVDLILVNGQSVSFNTHLRGEDRVAVYPRFESLDISPLIRLRPSPLRESKFVADVHLGKLVRYLRLLGFDTFFAKEMADDGIIEKSIQDRRIVLTRDLGILKNGRVTHGYWLRNTDPEEQIKEIARRFDLKNSIHPFSLCLECNTPLVSIEKDKISKSLHRDTIKHYDLFFMCPTCKRIYWEGSHHEKMKIFINNLFS